MTALLLQAAEPASAPVTAWPARIALTVLTLAVFVLAAYGMRRGWRRKAASQAGLLPLPAPPGRPAQLLLPAAGGLYVGTTISGDWQARVVAGQLSDRAAGSMRLTSDGLLLDRIGAPQVFIPTAAVRDARLDSAAAGKAMGAQRLLVVTWEHRGELLDTAFRADQHSVHLPYLHAILGLIGGAPGAPGGALGAPGGARGAPGDAPVAPGGATGAPAEPLQRTEP